MKRILILLLSFIFLLVSNVTTVYAHTTTQKIQQTFKYFSMGSPLTSILKETADNFGVAINVSNNIYFNFKGKLSGNSFNAILKQINAKYKILSYNDGALLYIYKADELKKKILSLSSLSPKQAITYLQETHFLDDKVCQISEVKGLQTVIISGVPACINHISNFISELDKNANNDAATQREIKAFPLIYASASDNVYQYRDQKVTVPGIVSLLTTMTKSNQNNNKSSENKPEFSADTRQNSVIINGSKQDIKLYSQLIKQLDIPLKMIEISVSIIDVDASDSKQLGVDWSASAKIGGGTISLNQGVSPTNAQGGFSTIISNTNDFMVRLNLLESHSKAKVLSRPSVVTMNNVQAILDKNITFYTKLQSNKVANLQKVTTGTLLRVTPRLINEKGKSRVMLTLNIQDGQQAPAVSDTETLPQIQGSEISTQASLKTGESLLLGGFIQNKDQIIKNKIPLLGDIPILSKLFSSTGHEKQSVMRLFLIKAEPIILG